MIQQGFYLLFVGFDEPDIEMLHKPFLSVMAICRHRISCIPILIVRIGCGLNSYEIPKHSRETTNSFLTQPFFLTSFVKELICTAN